jgi:2-polyprenyl-3-methyl-5-hydroxy-6-metoxy-1,4-benzoquinol methylase
MPSSLRNRVAKNPLVYPLKVMVYLVKAPKSISQFRNDLHAAHIRGQKQEKIIETLQTDNKKLEEILTKTNNRLSNINHRLNTPASPAAVNDTGYRADTIADDPSLDNFYIAFEDKFRGSEKMIKERLGEHLNHFKENETGNKKLPIVDLGCGRGELLSLLKDNHIPAIGVDMNSSMVERARSNGFDAVQNDAISYLIQQKNNSVAAITGFHLVEHLPFGMLIRMFEECYRVVAKNGYVFFETPNPENIMVGSCNFYMDPSHINPLPPDLLAFALDTVGFSSEIIRLHPVQENIEHKDPIVKDMATHLYGSRDYAVKAYKR